MIRKKLLFVFGTRPEAIKMAPVIEVARSYSEFETKVCVTAQHREMLDQVLLFFGITPDFDLNIMKGGQNLFDVTDGVIRGMKKVFEDFMPDVVLVHGDTTSAFATSLAAFYKKIDIAHIEAGLRTNDLFSPWPEEANRQLVARMAKFHFSPTNAAAQNLKQENVSQKFILVTGNTVIDALHYTVQKIEENLILKETLRSRIGLAFNIETTPYIMVTGHRRENFGEGFENVCNALARIAEMYPTVQIVYPVHLNPQASIPVRKILGDINNVWLIPPLNYESFVFLMKNSFFVITDSGGIQEEAPSLGKPVLLTRNTTERPEALECGSVKLVGTDKEKIISEAALLLSNEEVYAKMSNVHNPYGDGQAAKRIMSALKAFFFS